MQFRKYNSIENAYRKIYVEEVREAGFFDEVFVVQEKVHGANLSFITDGKAIQTAKRTSLLEENEKFYNFQQVRDRRAEQILAVFDKVQARYPETEFISIYGELFGGTYPHKEVEKVKGSIKIQKGIYYAPYNDFYAFDIRINNEEYVNIEVANAIFEEVGLLYAKTLFKGNLEACLAYPNAFQSVISQWLGLPQLTQNIAEGVVIKSVENLTLSTGARIIFKNKNGKWEEKVRREKKAPIVLSDGLVALQKEIADYVTLNRLNNVVSKIGTVTPKEFGKVIGLFSKDVLEDFHKDYSQEYESLEKKEQKMLTKSLNKLASELVRREL